MLRSIILYSTLSYYIRSNVHCAVYVIQRYIIFVLILIAKRGASLYHVTMYSALLHYIRSNVIQHYITLGTASFIIPGS